MQLERAVRRRSRVALTPLIDVVFILLLFFMLTTRFGQQRAMRLSMPGPVAPSASTVQDMALLRLDETGTLDMPDGSTVTPDALAISRELIRIREQGLPVALQVDAQASLQALVSALDGLEAAGLLDVSVRGLR